MNSKIKQLTIAALFAALACVATMIIKIPSPLKGYLNIGDCVDGCSPLSTVFLPRASDLHSQIYSPAI